MPQIISKRRIECIFYVVIKSSSHIFFTVVTESVVYEAEEASHSNAALSEPKGPNQKLITSDPLQQADVHSKMFICGKISEAAFRMWSKSISNQKKFLK